MIDSVSQAKTHYDILRIAPDASAEEVRAAYRSMSSRFHPDRHPRHPEAASRIMASINVAYDVLSDPVRRADYDHELRHPRRREPIRGWAPRSPGPVPDAWQSGIDPAPFFGRHRNPEQEASVHRRAVAVRRLMTVSALFCAAGLAIGAWMAVAPHFSDPQPDIERIVEARNQQRAGASAPAAGTDDRPASRPADTVHIRPLESPNGTPWPSLSGELAGYARGFADGDGRLTLDNRLGPSDVFAKIYRFTEDGLIPVRHVFVRAREQLSVEQMRPGEYEVRYLSLDTGQTLRSVRLAIAGASNDPRPQSFRLDDMQGRSGRAVPIPREEFQAPALQLRLSHEPSTPSAGTR